MSEFIFAMTRHKISTKELQAQRELFGPWEVINYFVFGSRGVMTPAVKALARHSILGSIFKRAARASIIEFLLTRLHEREMSASSPGP